MELNVRKVLILGSSALKIGEAGEFDYSGSQAIKAMKEEDIRTILINPNIATIQTSDHLADEVYFLPVSPYFAEKVIEKEKPDAILLGFGGQTALNCGLELARRGVLERHGIRVLGSPIATIRDTEDRDLFAKRLAEIGVRVPVGRAATTVDEALDIARELGFPVIMRIAFALGGLGSGVCRDESEVRTRAQKSLTYAPQVLVEEYLEGWKEIEYEVMRDAAGNCITICNMENVDAMGIHTGESIVVAPSQTLSNREFHILREAAIRVVSHLGVVGECNIQYALNPKGEDFRVIEVNARLSRSSALASKATGYPIAFVASKVVLGKSLYELPNAITRTTKAFFEPSLDYVVVKVPRWDLKKFRNVSRRIGSAMKSVGEVMAIGRTFEEAMQKALRMVDVGARGLARNTRFVFHDMEEELRRPTEERIFAVVEALYAGMSVDRIHELSHIDKWFLHKMARVMEMERELRAFRVGEPIPSAMMEQAKRLGFSDLQIALATKQGEDAVRALRHSQKIRPRLRRIDTVSAEYPAHTNYLYLSYDAVEDEVEPPTEPTVLILGSGVYRIGCSVEFDWCCVNTGSTLRKLGYKTVMLNFNPETVSTDYDESDMLVFDEISFEVVLELVAKLKPVGVVVSMGGQIPNNLAVRLQQAGIPILGTNAASIDRAEDRQKFSAMLDVLGVSQPDWAQLNTPSEAKEFATRVGYPVLVRPSYVLSGAAMAVASNDIELERYLAKAVDVSTDHPVVISKFLENAKEIEFDAVAKNGELIVYAISEHVENAGVHSGDATLVLPPQRTYLETIRQIRKIAAKIAAELKIHGPFNMQFIAKNNEVFVIECNLRASRSFPFVSKVLSQNFVELATRVMIGESVPRQENRLFDLEHVGVKASQFSFTRLEGADPTLGVEMASTGEVGCLGDTFEEAFLKALLSVGFRLPIQSILWSTGSIESKAELLESARLLSGLGIKFYATPGTAHFFRQHGLPVEILYWPSEHLRPNTIDYIRERRIDLVVNIPKNTQEDELANDYAIRRAAVDFTVPLITNRQMAMRLAEALSWLSIEDLAPKSWSEYTT